MTRVMSKGSSPAREPADADDQVLEHAEAGIRSARLGPRVSQRQSRNEAGESQERPADDLPPSHRGRPRRSPPRPPPGATMADRLTTPYGICSMRRVTARLNVQLGTTAECLPVPLFFINDTATTESTW